MYESIFQNYKNGVIIITANDAKVLHSRCFFENCIRDDRGGSVYMACYGSIVQHNFCAINSNIRKTENSDLGPSSLYNYGGAFSFTTLTGSSQYNIISESSIIQCANEEAVGTIYCEKGIFGIYASNISKNKMDQASGYLSAYAYGTGILNFSTIDNNTEITCFCLAQAFANYYYYCCNIINNIQIKENGGIILLSTQRRPGDILTIENCTFRGNSKDRQLFSTHGQADYIIKNCNIDEITTSQHDSDLFHIESVWDDDKYDILKHILTYKCDSKNTKGEDNQKKEETLDIPRFSLAYFIYYLIHKLLLKH